MKTKLNLTIDPNILQKARKLSKREHVSLSALFEKLILMHALKESSDHDDNDWLAEFHRRNEKKLDQITDQDVKLWISERGKKI